MNIEQITLDKLFQKLSNGKKCHFCNNRANASHHIYGRANKLLRHYHKNALPVCCDLKEVEIDGKIMQFLGCHQMLHTGFLEYEPDEDLRLMANLSYKQYLLEHMQTRQDLFKERKLELEYILTGEY